MQSEDIVNTKVVDNVYPGRKVTMRFTNNNIGQGEKLMLYIST